MATQQEIIDRPRQNDSPLVVLSTQLEKRKADYKLALPSHIKPEDLQRTVVMAAQQNPKLLEADRRTLLLSCMKAAQDGLLPDGREAALVPFSSRRKNHQGRWESYTDVVYMPMVYGLRKKIMQSDEISTMTVGVVYRAEYESGRFLYELGIEPPIRHKPDLTLSDEDIADANIIAAYSLVKFKDGSYSGEVMRRAEIDKIRELSQTGATKDRDGNPRESKGPWADHFAEMAKKTVMRRHAKVLPMSGDIFRDVEGQEQETAIQSAVQTLDAVQEAAPVALPNHNETTGEVIDQAEDMPTDPATGMTEVDEETARALDAGEQPADEPEQQDEPTPSEAKLAEIRSRIANAKTIDETNAIDSDWTKAMAAYDEATVLEVDKELAAKRSAIREGKA